MDYTKGEWQAIPYGDGSWYVTTDDSDICRVHTYDRNDHAKANAHLIAASPDMYEAIRLYHKHQVGKRGHFCAECWAKLEDALAKAEGK